MGQRLETLATSAVIIAALTVAGSSAYRTVRGPGPSETGGRAPPRYIEDWQVLLNDGIVVGDASASTTLIEFTDFECPFCRNLHETLKRVRQARGKDLRFVLVHYPLTQHAFALGAARAAECAHAAGRFEEIHDLLFEKQDSLGAKTWQSFGAEAGVADTIQFGECARSSLPVERIQRGIAAGERIKVGGTPTVIINGWMYDGLSPDSLDVEIARRSKNRTRN